MVQDNRRMPRKKRARFNPKKEVSVMAWIEDDKGSSCLFAKPSAKSFGHSQEAR